MSLNGKKHYEEDTQRTKIVSNEGHNVYGLASGWRYDFPWIETVTLTEEEDGIHVSFANTTIPSNPNEYVKKVI